MLLHFIFWPNLSFHRMPSNFFFQSFSLCTTLTSFFFGCCTKLEKSAIITNNNYFVIVSYSDAIGRMRVLSVKTALSTLCAGRLVDKLRCKSLSHFIGASKLTYLSYLAM